MGRKIDRTCIICGSHYSYCPQCGEDANKPTWYFIFDGQNCHDIYEICVAYRDKKINITEAYEELLKVNISNLDNFVEATKVQIREILDNGKSIKQIEKPKQNNAKINIKK